MKRLLLFILLCPLITISQTQIGQDIDGVSSYSYFGSFLALSSDGNTVATSAIFNDDNASNSGLVQVFRHESGSWSQIGQNIYGQNENNYVGNLALSANGNILVLGAAGNFLNGGGYAQIYEYNGGAWIQIGDDIVNESVNDDSGGFSISANGNVVAIGAAENFNNGVTSGHVRVYENNGSVWTQIGDDIDGENQYDDFGLRTSLSSDGKILAIAAHQNDGNGSNAGHVRVFENLGGTWTQIGNDIDGEAQEDNFGSALSLSSDGSILAVGAPNNDGNGTNSGHVRLFENIAGDWIQFGGDIDGENAGDQSGSSVSLSSDGSILAIGARLNDGNGSNSGHVRLFQNIAGNWTQIGSDIDGENSGDESGITSVLSGNGEVLAIGASNNNDGGSFSGQVRVYDLSTTLSVNDIISDDFSLFPNPTSDKVTINLGISLELYSVTIYNFLGQGIKKTTRHEIDISEMPSGLYFIEIFTNEGKAMKRIIKK